VSREFGAYVGPEIATLKLRSARAGVSKTSPVTQIDFPRSTPAIHDLRDLIQELPDDASLHAVLGFCLKRIEDFDAARASLLKAESLLRDQGHLEIADKLRSFIPQLVPKPQ